MMDRYICIHGHFYQPPRENPWLEAIEQQDSAAPYHDWNARITKECYWPNAHARLMDDDGWLCRAISNYARMSFNFGPTLLSWLEAESPTTYAAILRADASSRERFGGHGSAMAQAYNHLIMPLASGRDRRTQVRWGIRDFEHRFGRMPEGMWLPETAADVPTLEALAEAGIRFTLLAPRQARRWRAIGDDEWTACPPGDGCIDPSRPYLHRLPSGREIALFFYDGPISQAVAFERLLDSGAAFAQRIETAFHDGRDGAQLAHIATDGETYGHHHPYGEMALAWVLDDVEHREDITLTNYAQFLADRPPRHEVEIHEGSSWSCVHGIERWRSDCGCSTGGRPGWSQAWRGPLRRGLDALSGRLAHVFEQAAARYLTDPWAARDDYISVILDRSDVSVDRFFDAHGVADLSDEGRIRALELLESQRHAMLMFTSCGWFFDDLAGIETVQVLRYAARAAQLAERFAGADPASVLLAELDAAESNPPHRRGGRRIWEEDVLPSVITLAGAGAHFAVSTLFDGEERARDFYCFHADVLDAREHDGGRARLRIGRARLTSTITRESEDIGFAVLHLGDHIINGGARPYAGADRHAAMAEELRSAFEVADFAAIITLMNAHFGTSHYSLSSLFADEQRHVARQVLAGTIETLEETYSRLHAEHTPLIRFLGGLGIPAPRALLLPAEFVINHDIAGELDAGAPDPERIRALFAEGQRQAIRFDRERLVRRFELMLERLARAASASDDPTDDLLRLAMLVRLTADSPVPIDTGPSQLTLYRAAQRWLAPDAPEVPRVAEALRQAAEVLRVRVPS